MSTIRYVQCKLSMGTREAVVTWLVYRQIEWRFHSWELKCQPLHLVLDPFPLSNGSKGSSRTSLDHYSYCQNNPKRRSRHRSQFFALPNGPTFCGPHVMAKMEDQRNDGVRHNLQPPLFLRMIFNGSTPFLFWSCNTWNFPYTMTLILVYFVMFNVKSNEPKLVIRKLCLF